MEGHKNVQALSKLLKKKKSATNVPITPSHKANPARKARKTIIILQDGVERGYLGAVTGLRGNYGVYIAVTEYMHGSLPWQ